jgi:hypothetical protein
LFFLDRKLSNLQHYNCDGAFLVTDILPLAASMSFSTLVSDIAFGDTHPDDQSSLISHPRSQVTAQSYASTTATSISISGNISSQLHAGYGHPLSRAWQAERQLTKVRPTDPLLLVLYSASNLRSDLTPWS